MTARYCPTCHKDQPAIRAGSQDENGAASPATPYFQCGVCRTPVGMPPSEKGEDGGRTRHTWSGMAKCGGRSVSHRAAARRRKNTMLRRRIRQINSPQNPESVSTENRGTCDGDSVLRDGSAALAVPRVLRRGQTTARQATIWRSRRACVLPPRVIPTWWPAAVQGGEEERWLDEPSDQHSRRSRTAISPTAPDARGLLREEDRTCQT